MAVALPIYWPFPPSLVREWPGTRPAGMAPHWGTDFAVDAGTPVPATSDGVIVYAGDDGLGGYTIDLLRDDGLLQRFGHLTWGSGRVKVGQRVKAGEIIALSGYSGAVIPKGPNGAHLHWELRWDRAWSAGRWVDPRTLHPSGFTTPEPAGQEEDEEMAADQKKAVFYNAPDGVQTVIIGQPFSGWKFRYTTKVTKGRNAENEKWARVFDTGDFEQVTDPSMLDAWERSLDEKRQGK